MASNTSRFLKMSSAKRPKKRKKPRRKPKKRQKNNRIFSVEGKINNTTFIAHTFTEKRAKELKKAMKEGKVGFFKRAKNIKIQKVSSTPTRVFSAGTLELTRKLRGNKFTHT